MRKGTVTCFFVTQVSASWRAKRTSRKTGEKNSSTHIRWIGAETACHNTFFLLAPWILLASSSKCLPLKEYGVSCDIVWQINCAWTKMYVFRRHFMYCSRPIVLCMQTVFFFYHVLFDLGRIVLVALLINLSNSLQSHMTFSHQSWNWMWILKVEVFFWTYTNDCGLSVCLSF